jgi:hypothetical protein
MHWPRNGVGSVSDLNWSAGNSGRHVTLACCACAGLFADILDVRNALARLGKGLGRCAALYSRQPHFGIQSKAESLLASASQREPLVAGQRGPTYHPGSASVCAQPSPMACTRSPCPVNSRPRCNRWKYSSRAYALRSQGLCQSRASPCFPRNSAPPVWGSSRERTLFME